MQDSEDIALLRRYSAEKSEEAFAALVSRHLNLVYATALRQARDPHLAEEITQTVFVLLSKKARSIGHGVILSGWLHRATGYVTSDALRAENRRRNRETAAMQNLYEPSPPDQLEPILDRALEDLDEVDRNVVLLRYFEKKSLKEVGALLGVTEDAAQKRVARAIEKLRHVLIRRGASTTAAGLTAALAVFAAQSAPPALAASVLTITAASVAPVGVSFATQATLKFMAMTKMKLAAGVVIVVATVSTPLVMQQTALKDLRQENEALRAEVQRLQAPAETPIAAAETPAAARAQTDRVVAVGRNQLQMAPESRVIRAISQLNNDPAMNDPHLRQDLGDKLAAEGKFAEALENYLWCYDEGAKQSPAYVGVRGSFLLMKIKQLAEKYPAARDALAARRDEAEQAILNGGPSDTKSVFDLIQLNANLDEPNRAMALFDQLPATSPARAQLVDLAGDQFLRASRYQDMVEAGHPETALSRAIGIANLTKDQAANNEMIKGEMRRQVMEAAGRGIEALAGVGQIERANAMIDKAVGVDQSPEMKGELMKYARRAGNPNVIEHLKSKSAAH